MMGKNSYRRRNIRAGKGRGKYNKPGNSNFEDVLYVCK